jgi:hypothetical protein
MSAWGMTLEQAAALPERHALMLMRSYLARQRFESRVLIAQLADAMQPKREQGSLAGLAALGFGIRGA